MLETKVYLKGTRRQSNLNFPRELYDAQIVMHYNIIMLLLNNVILTI